MSAPADRTVDEWAALCASQALIIQELVKEKHERAHRVKKLQSSVRGMSDLINEQNASYNILVSAGTTLITTLKEIKVK